MICNDRHNGWCVGNLLGVAKAISARCPDFFVTCLHAEIQRYRNFSLWKTAPIRESVNPLCRNAKSDSNSTERRAITHRHRPKQVTTGNRSSETIRVENCADGIQFLVRTTARGAEWSDRSDEEIICSLPERLCWQRAWLCKKIYPGKEENFADDACQQWDSLSSVHQ